MMVVGGKSKGTSDMYKIIIILMWLRDPLLPRMSVGSGIISAARIARNTSGVKVRRRVKRQMLCGVQRKKAGNYLEA
jgi:hypothetical protein